LEPASKGYTLLYVIKLFRYLAAPALVILLWAFSSRPPSLPDAGGLPTDKIIHFIVYAALSLSIGLQPVFLQREISFSRAVAVITSVTAAIGLLDEMNQLLLIGRDASILDWLADLFGAAFGAALFSCLRFRRRRCAFFPGLSRCGRYYDLFRGQCDNGFSRSSDGNGHGHKSE
jgi:VanZ family protein